MSLDDFIESTDIRIKDLNARGIKAYYGMSVDILGTENIVDTLTDYYNNLQYGIMVKRCKYGSYDVSIWWD